MKLIILGILLSRGIFSYSQECILFRYDNVGNRILSGYGDCGNLKLAKPAEDSIEVKFHDKDMEGSSITGGQIAKSRNENHVSSQDASNQIIYIYPNPVQKSFSIYGLEKGQNYECAIYSMDGGERERIKLNSLSSVCVDFLTKGEYIIEIRLGSEPIFRNKLIKI